MSDHKFHLLKGIFDDLRLLDLNADELKISKNNKVLDSSFIYELGRF